jgi:hypothetical protein
MNRTIYSARGRAGAAAALIIAAGLVLTACGGSGNGSSNSGNSSNSGSSVGSSSSPSSSTTSSSSTSGGGSTSTVSSNSVPFPIAVGNTWVYKSVSLAGTSSTVTNKILTVTPVSGGNEVTMSNSNTLGGATTQITYIFHSDGSITYPFTQLGTSATIVKGSLQWPPASVIASGQPTSSTLEIAATAGTTKTDVTAHIVVKGDGTATVTVPAGTYSATIVQMKESFTVEGHAETIVVKTWVASGVGPVQSEASISAASINEIVSHLELVSFTKG